jgi:hypothetical protein
MQLPLPAAAGRPALPLKVFLFRLKVPTRCLKETCLIGLNTGPPFKTGVEFLEKEYNKQAVANNVNRI